MTWYTNKRLAINVKCIPNRAMLKACARKGSMLFLFILLFQHSFSNSTNQTEWSNGWIHLFAIWSFCSCWPAFTGLLWHTFIDEWFHSYWSVWSLRFSLKILFDPCKLNTTAKVIFSVSVCFFAETFVSNCKRGRV